MVPAACTPTSAGVLLVAASLAMLSLGAQIPAMPLCEAEGAGQEQRVLFLQLVAAPRAAHVGGLAAAAVCGLGVSPRGAGQDPGFVKFPV